MQTKARALNTTMTTTTTTTTIRRRGKPPQRRNMMSTTALEVIVRDASDTEEVADIDQPSKDEEEVDHEIDLTEADKQLREHDTEVKELMEDILNKQENNDEEPVPLINDVTSEMARKTVEVDGKQVYKTSLTCWMN